MQAEILAITEVTSCLLADLLVVGNVPLRMLHVLQEFVDVCLGNIFTLDTWLEKSYAQVLFEDHHEQIIIW